MRIISTPFLVTKLWCQKKPSGDPIQDIAHDIPFESARVPSVAFL